MTINMLTSKDWAIKHCRVLLASIFMMASSAIATGQIMQDESTIAVDLNIALTLQGINCDGISEIEKTRNEGYEVVCNEGGHYSVSKTANGLLSVIDKLTGLIFKGAGRLYGTIPFTGQIFQTTDKVTEANAEVARSLFSIIELSGHVCEAITSVAKKSTDDHLVFCANKSKYHVYTSTDGQVAVDEEKN